MDPKEGTVNYFIKWGGAGEQKFTQPAGKRRILTSESQDSPVRTIAQTLPERVYRIEDLESRTSLTGRTITAARIVYDDRKSPKTALVPLSAITRDRISV